MVRSATEGAPPQKPTQRNHRVPTASKTLPPIRIRREPPTLGEAIAAAQGLTDNLDQQATIAAGLMGLGEDEVRPQVVEAFALQKEHGSATQRVVAATGARASFVVVARTPRRRLDEPKPPLARPR
jgi:hypothetical protein